MCSITGCLAAPHATPASPIAAKALATLLTEPLAARLAHPSPLALLELLNGSMETAQCIWNNTLRAELLTLLEAHRSGSLDVAALAQHQYGGLRNELSINGVYVRVYNHSPGTLPADTAAFFKGLVRHVHQLINEQAERGAAVGLLDSNRRGQVLQCLTALSHLLELEPRLLGVLASKSALAPVVAGLLPAVLATAPSAGASQQVAAAHKAEHGSETGEGSAAAVVGAQDADQNSEHSGSSAAESASLDAAAQAPASSSDTISSAGKVPDLAFAESLAFAALTVLRRSAQHTGCLDAMLEESTVRMLFWLCNRPISARTLRETLELLKVMSGHQKVGFVAGNQAGAMYLLALMLHSDPWSLPPKQIATDGEAAETLDTSTAEALRQQASAVLSKLLCQPLHGPCITNMLQKVLPPGIVAAIAGPSSEDALAALSQTLATPECIWGPEMRAVAAEEVSRLCKEARSQQVRFGRQ